MKSIFKYDFSLERPKTQVLVEKELFSASHVSRCAVIWNLMSAFISGLVYFPLVTVFQVLIAAQQTTSKLSALTP